MELIISKRISFSLSEYYGLNNLHPGLGLGSSENIHFNGMKEGLCIKWSFGNMRRYEGHFRNGKEEGSHIKWSLNGLHKTFEGCYKNGKKDGLHIERWYTGETRDVAYYINGKYRGKWAFIYKDHNSVERIHVIDKFMK